MFDPLIFDPLIFTDPLIFNLVAIELSDGDRALFYAPEFVRHLRKLPAYVEPMLALRVVRANDDWDDYWEKTAEAA